MTVVMTMIMMMMVATMMSMITMKMMRMKMRMKTAMITMMMKMAMVMLTKFWQEPTSFNFGCQLVNAPKLLLLDNLITVMMMFKYSFL